MSSVTQDTLRIGPETMLPDLLKAHPHVRPVLDRYGLRGCGGEHGPAESIEYFARVHGVELEPLLDELRTAAADPSAVSASEPADEQLDALADRIYQRFFKAGIVVVLTAGAVWGAILLLRIGFTGEFTAASIHEINAHGHAQIFGWVGLFVMGFAYQAFPRMKHTNLWRPDLANLTFYLMVIGIFTRAVGEPLFRYSIFRELALVASVVEIVAIGLFVWILLKTFAGSGKRYEIHDAYIVAALCFFVIQAVYDMGLLYATTGAATRAALLDVIATWQAPLRDLQIHGFAMLMILGVGLRMFPALYGFTAPRPRWQRIGLIALLLAIVGETTAFIAFRLTGDMTWVRPLYAAILVLAVTSIGLTLRWGLLARPDEPDRSTKFVRAATFWLHLSMVMLVLAPVYMYALLPAAGSLSASGRQSVDIGFSHAYYGAVRHAITVGFISLSILGMAAKVVPTLRGIDVRQLAGLWLPFVLVNIGCAMRVGFQVMTDFAEWAYPITGVSGLLEVTGIAIWGVHLWRIMAAAEPGQELVQVRPQRIEPDHMVGAVTSWFPETLPVFLDRGLTPLANPLLRRTLGRTTSIRAAARRFDLDLDALVADLNRVAYGNTHPLPVLTSPAS